MADLASQVSQLAQQLTATVQAGDWDALRALDTAMVALLSRPRTSPWNGRESAALQELRSAHQNAREHCAMAVEDMTQRLSQMRQNKDGWIAYAINSD